MTTVYVLVEGTYNDGAANFAHGSFSTLDAAIDYSAALWPAHSTWCAHKFGTTSNGDLHRLEQREWSCSPGGEDDGIQYLVIFEARIDPVADPQPQPRRGLVTEVPPEWPADLSQAPNFTPWEDD